MIQITSDKGTVTLNLKMSIGWSVDFDYMRNSTMDAILLRNQMQNDLYAKIEKIRKDAYELGWKEAKSKKVAKKTCFNGNINSDFVG